MVKNTTVFVPLFLALQGGFVYWVASGERLPAKPDLTRFPDVIANWGKVRNQSIEPSVIAQLGADQWLESVYLQRKTGMSVDFFVAWFQSQRGGASQPHSPQVCLPGAGWTFNKTSLAALDTEEGTISINQEIASYGGERTAVLYWYQTPRHVIASEWAAKFWVVADAVRDRRTDTSLVRVMVPNGGRSDEETTATAREFARKAYHALREILPR